MILKFKIISSEAEMKKTTISFVLMSLHFSKMKNGRNTSLLYVTVIIRIRLNVNDNAKIECSFKSNSSNF